MKKVVGLLAGLCLCAGCENEIPEPTASVVSAGKFVVDYTTAAGAATRVIHENQPKGVRINSLTYLLYSEEGTLEKRREIPGLDTDGESWPLRRENMSWEQREALKDTCRRVRPIMRSLWPISIPPFAGGQVRTVSRGLPCERPGRTRRFICKCPSSRSMTGICFMFSRGTSCRRIKVRSGESLQLSGRVAACGDPYRLLV